ncbi:unnamed protein product [Coregonus sp. 'balchen']|nr:unnamed protein product [Coregonus sp. 'balchen']
MRTFKSFGVLVSLCFVFAYTSATADIFDGVLGNTASCHKTCQMTYSLHTYPRFVGDSEDLNQTKVECDSTCHEAYRQSDEQYACNLGCQSQLPFAEQRQEQLLAMMPRIHLLYPLTLVRGFWDDVMSQAHNMMSSSWTFYLQADDGKLVIFQERDRDMYVDRSINKDDYNLFSCLSRNPWLPGWILTTTLIMSILVLIWICCATVATAVDQYVPAEKLSIYGDMEYAKDNKLLTPYPASSLVIITSGPGQDEEAGPLPSKVNLDQSNV